MLCRNESNPEEKGGSDLLHIGGPLGSRWSLGAAEGIAGFGVALTRWVYPGRLQESMCLAGPIGVLPVPWRNGVLFVEESVACP